MKKLLTVLMLSVACGVALAEEKPTAEAKIPLEVQLAEFRDAEGDDDLKVPVGDIKKGVFIVASATGWTLSHYEKTSELLKGLLKAKGFNVVDKIEDADVGIQVVEGFKFGSFKAVENDVGSLTTGQALGTNLVKDAIMGALTGNISMVGRAQAFDAKKLLQASTIIFVVKNPKFTSRQRMDGDDSKNIVFEIAVKVNRAPEQGEGFQPKLLSMLVSKFIDQHFTGLPAPAGTQATTSASGVQSVTPVAAN